MKKINYKFILIIGITIILVSLFLTGFASAREQITLEETLKLGMENNTGLLLAIHDKNKAVIDLNSAKKAFYPEVSASTSYTRMFLPESITFELMQPSENNYQTSISVQQPIYLGGKIWLGLDQAGNGLDMAEIQVEQKKNEVLFQIIQSYYNVLLAQERVDVEEEALELVREHKRTAEVSYSAGTILKTDILQVEIEEGKAIHSLELARNDLLMAKKMLGNTIGIDLTNKNFVWPILNPDLKLEKDYQYQEAKMNRSELELLNINQDILKTNLQIEKNSHLPNIVLSGNYQWQGEEFSLKDGSASITLAANINIFDRGLSRNKQNKLKEDLKKLDLNRSNIEELMEIEIEDLLLTIQENKNNIELQELNLAKADENLILETKRYKVGIGTNVNVMNAQMVLKQTRISQMQAEYQYKINLFKLLEKTGQLIEYCQGVIINE